MSDEDTTSREGELTPAQKKAYLECRPSDARTVETIANAGHGLSMAVAVGGAAAGGSCLAVPLAVGLPSAMLGGMIAHKLGLGGRVVELLGAPRMAARGPQPACQGHKIAHNHPLAGAIGSLVGGLLAAVLVGAAVAAVVGSGGLAAPALVVGISAGASGGVAGGLIGGMIGDIGSSWATVTGEIVEGSPNVFFEGKPVARLYDLVACGKHPPPARITEGSETIFVNAMPLARIGHKTTCSAVVQEGCSTIFADMTTKTYGTPDPELTVLEQTIVSASEVSLAISAAREGGLVNRSLRWALGEPIDAATGDYATYGTDFEYASILPLQLTRTYPGKKRVEGLLGNKWISSWSQRLLYDPDEPTAVLEDAEGQCLIFALGYGREFNSRHLKAPYYHLSGTRERARLFDARTQQTLIFTPEKDSPRISILSAIEDRNGNRIDFIYTGECLSRIVHSDGVAFTVKTTREGYIQSLAIEGDGRTLVRYSYDATGAMTDAHSLFEGEFHFAYTEEGWLKHWHDSGATCVDLEYDSEGRVIGTRTPDGMYNDRFIYHPEERKTEYIDATGACRTLWFNEENLLIREKDPLGNVTEHQWDGLERKKSSTDPLGRTTRFKHDVFGKLTGETDWAGRTRRYQYDKDGLLTEVEHPDGRKSTWKYDERGNRLSATRPDGVTFRWTYDDRGRILTETGPDNTTSRFAYTREGRLSSRRGPLGERTTFEQDTWGRLLAVTDPTGRTTRYHYEPGPENPREDVSRIIDPDGGEERFGYDREGLLALHTGAEGQLTRYRHGAFDLLRTITDPSGYSTKLDYDEAARLTRVTNASAEHWTYFYDGAGRLVVETDWAGRETTYRRDAVGRVLTKRLPDGMEQHLTWDERDRIVSIATATARIAYEYDESDRLTRAATYSLIAGNDGEEQNTEPETEVLLTYDKHGRLTREVQNGAAIDYRYDAAGLLTTRKSPSGETTLSYDLLGLLESFTSNGHALSFQRNDLGLETRRQHRFAETQRGQNSFALEQGYDPCGRLATQFAGRSREGLLQCLPPHLSPALDMQGQVSRRYTWDKSGRLIGVRDNVRGKTRYTYDPRDQVTRLERQHRYSGRLPSEHYRYDALTNLAQSNGHGHQYQRDCVTRVGSTTYHYDARGRVMSKAALRNGFRPHTWLYRWDDFDRLREMHSPEGERWRYTYDAFGRRVKKECLTPVKAGKPTSVTYLWQGATLTEEWQKYPDNNGGSSKPIQVNRWHFEPGAFKPLAKETLHQAGNNTRVLEREGFYPIVTDHLGTPKELFSTAGECLWQAEHSLWGKTSVVFQRKQKQRDSFGRETQADSPWPVVDCSLRFQNQWEDKESGLYYNLNRYYDPESGQYLSQDPIKLAGGLRSHGYVHNPMQWVDPWGLAGCAQTGTDVPDEALVRVDPTRLDKSISELGIQRRFFSDKKVWLTKYGDIKNVNNAKEFETMLYRKDLWPKVEGRFSEGATLRVVNNADDAVAAGLTNKTNGVRQWRITRDVSPDDLRVIGRLD